MVNKACLFRSKTTYVYLRLQHKQCKLVLKLQAQDYSGRIVNSRYAGGNQQVADNMLSVVDWSFEGCSFSFPVSEAIAPSIPFETSIVIFLLYG